MEILVWWIGWPFSSLREVILGVSSDFRAGNFRRRDEDACEMSAVGKCIGQQSPSTHAMAARWYFARRLHAQTTADPAYPSSRPPRNI